MGIEVGRHSSSRQNSAYGVNVFTESLSFEFESLPFDSIPLNFGTFPTVPKSIRIPHYSSSFDSGVTHNSASNDLSSESAITPISNLIEKGENSFAVSIDSPEILIYPWFRC